MYSVIIAKADDYGGDIIKEYHYHTRVGARLRYIVTVCSKKHYFHSIFLKHEEDKC